MFNNRVLAVLKRELRDKLMSKTFILMTLLLPVFMFIAMVIPSYIMSIEGDEGTRVEIITESPLLTQRFETSFKELDFVKDTTYIIYYSTVPESDLMNYIDSKKEAMLNEKLHGIVYIPNSALKDKKIQYYSKNPNNKTLMDKVRGPINKVLLDEFFSTKDLSEEELSYTRMYPDVTGYKVSEKEEIEQVGFGNLILAYLFMFLLYVSLIFSGQMTMQSVQDEKQSKIVEVLLSSVSSRELMTGKVLGATITSTFQMAIWLIPILLFISTTWFVLPPEFTFDITYGHLLYFLVNFFFGLLIFIGLFATVGAIFENAQEAQSGMWPIFMLLMIPLFIGLSILKNPGNPMAEIFSMIPFATITVMPGRFTAGDVPMWQLIVSILVNIATIAVIFPLAGKIYRVGILRTGKKPTWSEVIKWLKYKY